MRKKKENDRSKPLSRYLGDRLSPRLSFRSCSLATRMFTKRTSFTVSSNCPDRLMPLSQTGPRANSRPFNRLQTCWLIRSWDSYVHPHGHEHTHRGTEETEYFFSLLQQHGAAYRFLHLFNCLLRLHSLNQPSSRLFYFSMLSSAPLNRAPSAFGISLRPPCHSLGSFLLSLFSPLGLLLALCTPSPLPRQSTDLLRSITAPTY